MAVEAAKIGLGWRLWTHLQTTAAQHPHIALLSHTILSSNNMYTSVEAPTNAAKCAQSTCNCGDSCACKEGECKC